MSKLTIEQVRKMYQKRTQEDYSYKLERDKIEKQLDEVHAKKYPLSVLLTALIGYVHERELELKNAIDRAPEHDCDEGSHDCPLTGQEYKKFFTTIVSIQGTYKAIMGKESVQAVVEAEADTINKTKDVTDLLTRYVDFKE